MQDFIYYTISFLSLGWLFLIGWKMGYNKRDEEIVQAIQYLVDEKVEELEPEVPVKSSARIEKHDGIYYLWDIESEEFLAQGQDWDEVEDAIKHRFQGKKRVVVDREEAEAIGLL